MKASTLPFLAQQGRAVEDGPYAYHGGRGRRTVVRMPLDGQSVAAHQELSAYYFHPSRLDALDGKSGNVRCNGVGSLF
jgi:hypothetical protein